MKRKLRVFGLLGFSVLVLGIMACSNGIQNSAANVAAVAKTTSAKKSIPVTVSLSGESSATAAFKPRMMPSLSNDSKVTSVAIAVYNASSGASVGSGNLTKSGSSWAGKISVSETGSVVFEAEALYASGALNYVAYSSYVVTGANDSVTMAAGAVSLLGGSFQGQPLQMGSSISQLASGYYDPNGLTTDGTNLWVADWNNGIAKVVIATGTVTYMTVTGIPDNGSGAESPGGYDNLNALTSDGTNLYVTDITSGNIYQIAIATMAATPLGGATSPSTFDFGDNTWSTPGGITTDGNGYLYVTDYDGTGGVAEIDKVAISTGAVTPLVTGTSDDNYYGITTDGTNLYFVDNDNVEKVSIVGGTPSIITSGLASPEAVTMDGTNLLVGTNNNLGGGGQIYQIPLSSGTPTILAVCTSDPLDSLGITTDGMNLFISEGDDGLDMKLSLAPAPSR